MTEWEHDTTSGYYYNQTNACYYDPNSGFYYTDALGTLTITITNPKSKSLFFFINFHFFIFILIFDWVIGTGKWVTLQEALASTTKLSSGPIQKKPNIATSSSSSSLPSKTQPPTQSANRPSSIYINKRKRPDYSKPKVVSQEEAAALKAREAARKRVQEREKSSLGLYKHWYTYCIILSCHVLSCVLIRLIDKPGNFFFFLKVLQDYLLIFNLIRWP